MIYHHTILEPKTLTFKAEYYKCPDCNKKLERHIICEGARFHVKSWSNLGTQCSCEQCEVNHKCVRQKVR